MKSTFTKNIVYNWRYENIYIDFNTICNTAYLIKNIYLANGQIFNDVSLVHILGKVVASGVLNNKCYWKEANDLQLS